MPIIDLQLSQIMLDGGTQARAKLDFRYIAKLADTLKKGGKIEPIIVFFDGSKYWLADGFHRVRAAADAGQKAILAEIRSGDSKEALLYGLTAHAHSEAHRTSADKLRAVSLLLSDSEWSKWSDQEIADKLKVSINLVANLRKSIVRRRSNKTEREDSLALGQIQHSSTDIPVSIRQENLPVFDGITNKDDISSNRVTENTGEDIEAIPSAERCILIDPYLASPDIIAKVIEELKVHYRRKTGKEY